MGDWRPIETAPKDGRPVVLTRYAWLTDVSDLGPSPDRKKLGERLFDENAPKVWHCCWIAGGSWSAEREKWTDGIESLVPPTHWMPLPPAPTEAQP